ncbi:MAG: hypothetical protein DIZ79_17780 [endosymbiont of Lamellibrachia luymesi]|uniref:Sulfur globule protein CV3 n=1 Tax=endosymbiont of Lamellibrachia luymesi TaxID=2200907 RepID=A0A370DER6_9GAMM|nr:MAG: hypothetical protein DIZ79_17780 [endosymbiont of Lamellibrachia luymesi]
MRFLVFLMMTMIIIHAIGSMAAPMAGVALMAGEALWRGRPYGGGGPYGWGYPGYYPQINNTLEPPPPRPLPE